MQNNNLTRFDEGGLHHQNPLGGVPIGGNNTVEEGETKMKNYVYSNRLSIDENMTKEMNLPSYIKGKTFASASKAIDDKFKDRNDKHSLETKNVFLDRLKQAQETLKQQEQQKAEQIAQSMQSNQQEIPDMMNGEIPQGMEEFTEQNQLSLGGFEEGELGNLTGGGSGISGSGILGAGMGALSLGNLSQGVGASPNKNATALNGALTGAQAGMTFGPVGAGLGALVGLSAGIMGGNKAQREQARFAKKQALAYNTNVSGEYALGGNLRPWEQESSTMYDDPNYINPLFKRTSVLPEVDAPIRSQLKPVVGSKTGFVNFPNNFETTLPTNNKKSITQNNESPIDFKSIANQALRLSPVLSNFSQLKGLKRPNPVGYTPLRNTFQYDPIDETTSEKLISQEGNKQLSAIGQSGASQGAMRNAITAVGLNTTKARSNAAMEAESQNRAQRLAFQQSQLGVNQYNNQLQNKAIDETRMDQGNYDTQKSKFIGQIGSDLGEIGKEQVYRDKVGQLFGYDENGKYLVGPKGEKIRVSENKQTTTTSYVPLKLGGYITRKKY